MGIACAKSDATSAIADNVSEHAPHATATQSEKKHHAACLLARHEVETEPNDVTETYRDVDVVFVTKVPSARVHLDEGGDALVAQIPVSEDPLGLGDPSVHCENGSSQSTHITTNSEASIQQHRFNVTSSSIAASTAPESAALDEYLRGSSSCATLSGDRLCFATSPAANPLFAAAGSKSEPFDKKPSCSTKSSIKGFYVLPETPACDGLLLPQEVVHEGENITALPQLVDAPPLDPASATSFEASTQTYFVAAAGLLSLESENCDADDGVAWRSTMSSLRCPSEGGASGAGGDSARRSLRQQVTIDVMRLPRFKGFV